MILADLSTELFMRKCRRLAIAIATIVPAGLCALATASMAQDGAAVSAEQARANFGRAIVLAPDDKRAFPAAPPGFAEARPGVAGRIDSFAYHSAETGMRRTANVYLPPGFSKERRYPVLYLLHGIAGNHDEWHGYVRAHTILDNLIADAKAVPMIVVMPNGRALPDDRPPPADRTFTPEHVAGFARFERDLLDSLIPAVEAAYPALRDRQQRALAGLSMGGGQALNFGLAHLDTFASVGGFSSAPNTREAAKKSFEQNLHELLLDPARMAASGINHHKTILPRRARPYRLENGALQNAPWDDSGSHFSAGGMYSTVGDLYRWDRALRAGSVVSQAAQASMTTPIKGEAWNVFGFQQYGLGWWLKTHETLGRLAMHPGASPQYSAVVVRGLDRDLVIVALANVSSVPSMNKVVPALIEAVALALSPK